MSLSTTTNTSGRTPEQDAVICALIGLARAAEAKEIPAGTAPVLFAALASVAPGGSLSSSAANDLVEQIHKQKSIVSPDFEDRNRLLAELSQHAKEEWKRILAEQEDPEITRLFMDCVFMAGYAYEKELFAPYFEKLAALND